jgi:dTDP-4-dehydrorhamnose 3,5-epimerase
MDRVEEVRTTPLDGLIVIDRRPFEDDRGMLDRLFDFDFIGSLSPGFRPMQVNHTVTRHSATVRGMHYQLPPYEDTKIVTCLRGRVFDVAVDVRFDSPTFLSWHGEFLEPGNNRSHLIPVGFAHGFQALEGDCELLYVHGASYRPEAEAGIRPDDPVLGIEWPKRPTQMSTRDAAHPLLADDWTGIGK